jgi:hypothetical protein
MAERRDEDPLDRTERLEQSNRFWRGLAVGLLVILAAVGGLGVMQFTRAEQARREAQAQRELAADAEFRARLQAEEAARNMREFRKRLAP